MLNIHIALLIISFTFYILALMLTAITLEAMARTITIRDYAIYIKYRGALSAKVPKLFTVGLISMILSYVFLCAIIYSDSAIAIMTIGVVLMLVGVAFFALRLQTCNGQLNPRHKEQYAQVLEILQQLAKTDV